MLRAVRLAVALLLACLGLVVTVSAPASADCTCKQGQLDKQVAKADLVFIGTIDRVEGQGNGYLYDITASRTYQGTPERETQVLSAGGRDACGLGELGVGTSYVFSTADGPAHPGRGRRAGRLRPRRRTRCRGRPHRPARPPGRTPAVPRLTPPV